MWALHPLPSRSTFHFSLFTFHFPKGALFTLHFSLFTSRRDAFNFPQGPLFTFHSSLFTSRRDTFHLNDAVRCIGHRSALHWALQCAAQAVAVRCTGRCSALRFSVHFHARPGARRQALFSRRPKTKMLRDGIHRTALFALHFCPVCPACLSLCEAEGFSVPIYSRPPLLS